VPEIVRTAAEIPDALVRDGFELVPLRPSLRALAHGAMIPLSRGYGELRHALGMFGADTDTHARVLAGAIDSTEADVVVSDYLLFSASLAAKLRRRPLAAFYHSALPFPVPGRPPFGSGLPHDAPHDRAWDEAERDYRDLARRVHGVIARASAKLGLPAPSASLLEGPYGDACNLLATVRSLEPGLPEMPANTHFVGPCLDGRVEDERHAVFDALRFDGTRVYVSLGTVFNTDRRVFDAILRGLDRPEVRVVVSAGASHHALARRPPSSNAVLFPRVPQLAVLKQVDVVVTHGGNNSTLETIAAGKPMIVVPFGGDQLENARRVETLGTGVAVLPRDLSPRTVAEAFTKARACTTRATELAETLRGVDGTTETVRILEALR
jgi:MGT family glycosyltransferase